MLVLPYLLFFSLLALVIIIHLPKSPKLATCNFSFCCANPAKSSANCSTLSSGRRIEVSFLEVKRTCDLMNSTKVTLCTIGMSEFHWFRNNDSCYVLETNFWASSGWKCFSSPTIFNEYPAPISSWGTRNFRSGDFLDVWFLYDLQEHWPLPCLAMITVIQCVVRMTTLPCLYFLSRFQNSRLETASIPTESVEDPRSQDVPDIGSFLLSRWLPAVFLGWKSHRFQHFTTFLK